jgi:uncharacterized protein YkwD
LIKPLPPRVHASNGGIRKLGSRLVLFIPCAALGAWLAASAHAQRTRAESPDEVIAALSAARARGCAGQPEPEARLRPVAQLNQAAQRIARGEPSDAATKAAGYRSTRLFVMNMSGYGSPAGLARTMAEKHCKALGDPKLTDIGFHRQGASVWVVLAAPFAPPAQSAAADVAARVLTLTNQARSRARKCGSEFFEAAPPLKANPLLERAAAVHAQDMAQHSYLEHEDRDASSPADRVTRAGYPWRSVGENIASGQTSPEQVVQDWIGSPKHCANLMSPSFTEMGVAYAVNSNSASGIYWTEVFGRPR